MEERNHLAFRNVAAKARVISDNGRPVIVPFAQGADLIREIRERPPHGGLRLNRNDLRRLQRFMVNVRTSDYLQLQALELLTPLLPNMTLMVLSEGLYSSDVGLRIQDRPPEDFVL